MIPRLWLFIGGGIIIALAIAWVARLENRRAHWQETAVIWKETAQTWKDAFNAQKSAYVAAQEAAAAKAEARVKQDRVRYAMIAERIENAELEAAQLRAAADRFARANRVRNQRTATAGGAAGGMSAPSAPGSPEVDDRSDRNAVVAVPRSDFDQLVTLAIRAKENHDLGQAWLAEGLAVKVGEEQ